MLTAQRGGGSCIGLPSDCLSDLFQNPPPCHLHVVVNLYHSVSCAVYLSDEQKSISKMENTHCGAAGIGGRTKASSKWDCLQRKHGTRFSTEAIVSARAAYRRLGTCLQNR